MPQSIASRVPAQGGGHGELALTEPDLPSRKINPNQSSTAELLQKEGFHSKFIMAINLIASCNLAKVKMNLSNQQNAEERDV